jgi:hypothetical protein
MRKILFFIFLFISCFNADIFSQEKQWDSTYRPGSYTLMEGLFRSYPNSEKDIIFFGNSITAHVNWEELLGIPEARNRGISGDITFGLLERLDEVIEGHPAKIFILIGINDISRNIPDSVILNNDRKIIQRIKKVHPKQKFIFKH